MSNEPTNCQNWWLSKWRTVKQGRCCVRSLVFIRSHVRSFGSVRFVSSNGAHEPREASTSLPLSQSQSQSTSTAFSFIDLVTKVFLDSAIAIWTWFLLIGHMAALSPKAAVPALRLFSLGQLINSQCRRRRRRWRRCWPKCREARSFGQLRRRQSRRFSLCRLALLIRPDRDAAVPSSSSSVCVSVSASVAVAVGVAA